MLDRLRVLIAQELGEYRNMACNIYANHPTEGGTEAWIDLDVLSSTHPSPAHGSRSWTAPASGGVRST